MSPASRLEICDSTVFESHTEIAEILQMFV